MFVYSSVRLCTSMCMRLKIDRVPMIYERSDLFRMCLYAFRIFRINWDKTWDRPFCSNLNYILNCHYLREMKNIEAFKNEYATFQIVSNWIGFLVSTLMMHFFMCSVIWFLLRFICFLTATTKLLVEIWWSHIDHGWYRSFCRGVRVKSNIQALIKSVALFSITDLD